MFAFIINTRPSSSNSSVILSSYIDGFHRRCDDTICEHDEDERDEDDNGDDKDGDEDNEDEDGQVTANLWAAFGQRLMSAAG